METAPDGLIRIYLIKRSPHLGYGFVAGDESPTMVKIVKPDGPSYKRLLPGDVIMAINGVHVENAPREQIIKMIQLNDEQIEIKVRQPTYEELIRSKMAEPKFYTLNKATDASYNRCQPTHNISSLNRLVTSISQQDHSSNSPSSITNGDLSSNQTNQFFKTVLKQKSNNGTEQENNNNNNNAHFLVKNQPNYGRHSPIPQRSKSSLDHNGNTNKKAGDKDNDQPLLKRSNTMRPIKAPAKAAELLAVVLKIFFEVGHYRVLKYNQDTTVRTILETLNDRIAASSPHSEQIKQYFGLALTVDVDIENTKEQLPKRKLLHILDKNDSISKIRALPYWNRLRLLYRMVYPPPDVSTLYTQSKVAFEYLYQQSCNDLKLERFTPKLDQDTALKLSALHLLEYVHSNLSKAHNNTKDPKVYIRLVKKSPGIEHFLPVSMIDSGKKSKKVTAQIKKRLTEQLKKNFDEFDFEPPKVKSTTNLNCYSTTSFHELSLPEMQSSPSDYIKLLFLNYLSQLPCYGNSKPPQRTSTSPAERTSAGECSSSLESVPRTSDSSPLIKQERNFNNINNNVRVDAYSNQNISRLAQMNSMRSLSSAPSSSISQPVDQPDIAQTPSIESISSITFNMQNSPSPQHQATNHQPRSDESCPTTVKAGNLNVEPSPMPRQHSVVSRTIEYNTIDKLYGQRYSILNERRIEEFLNDIILLPPPPPSLINTNGLPYQVVNRRKLTTQVLSDKDIEKLRTPPPPRMIN